VLQRAFRYRLYPTLEQAEALAQFAGVTRFVYNLALEQRTTFWRQHRAQTGRAFTYASQGREVTQLRAQVDWIRAAPASALHQALRDLDRAFASFWRGTAAFPTPRRKGRNDTFRWQWQGTDHRRINRRWSAVRVPNLGWIKYRDSRPLCGRPLSATVSCVAGQWFVAIACEIEHERPANDLPAVGIDRGVANTLALSTGELLSTPATARLERLKKRAQRTLSRRKRGSGRYREQRRRVARIAAKITRIRAGWRHKATTDIARRFGLVALEDLKTANMTRSGRGKRGLNRSILEQGWRAFETVLAYKLEERGGALIKVDPAYTSQTCSACGTIDKASRESQASFACRSCGFAAHADTNAAINILRRSTSQLPVEASGCGAVEAGTVNRALAA
jgi:putative transposase